MTKSGGGKAGLYILLLSLLFVPYFGLCFYAWPAADDFTFTSASPYWNSYWSMLHSFNGRYASDLIALLDPNIFGSLAGYRCSAALLLLLLPVSLRFLLRAAMGEAASREQTTIISLIAYLLILALVPSLPQAIYWFSGSTTYILGTITASLYAGVAIKFVRAKIIVNRFLHLLLGILLLFLACGCNEVQTLLLVAFHLVIWFQLPRKERFKAPWIHLLVSCAIFSTLLIFSPGNKHRAAFFPDNHRLFPSLVMTALQMVRFFFKWIAYGPLLISGVLFIPFSRVLARRSPLFQRLGNMNPALFFMLLLLTMFLCIFPPYWGTGILGQYRTLNTACYCFIPLWFLFLHSVYVHNHVAEKITALTKRKFAPAMFLLLVATIAFSGNSGTALEEFATGKIQGFDKEMQNRLAFIEDAKRSGRRFISVPALLNRPQSLFVLDFQPGCSHWINQIEANYYGLDKICVDTGKQGK